MIYTKNNPMPYKIGQTILYEYFEFGNPALYKGYKLGIIKKMDYWFTEKDGKKIEHYHFYYEVIEYTMVYQGRMISFPNKIGEVLDFFPNCINPPIILGDFYSKQLKLF